MRSKLFVPCSRPEFFQKALSGDADALSFDLEDAVPANSKADARARLSEWLRSDAVRASQKRVIVRVNGPDTPHFIDDIAAIADGRLDLVNIPKAESGERVREVVAHLERARVEADLLVNIETPLAIANAAEIAAAHRRVAGVQVGLNDLFAALGASRSDAANVHPALWQVRVAAAAAGCFAYDGAWPQIADTDGFRTEAITAQKLGYLGKTCVHPRQVAIANAVFDRSKEVERARRLLKAAADAAARGHGAFVFEDAMIDGAAIAAARETVRWAGGSE